MLRARTKRYENRMKLCTLSRSAILYGVLLTAAVIEPLPLQAQAPSLPDSALAFLVQRDSVLNTFSLEELERFRNYYTREITRLQNERLELRKRGIRDGELFLARKPQSKNGDKIVMRLAELYYEQAQDDFQIEMQEYDRLYALFERGQLAQPPKEPRKNINKALELYVTVVEKYANGDLVDDAFFNIGFLLEEAGHADSARTYYEKVIADYPKSPLRPDALMRIGEYYFNPPMNLVEKAIEYFERILPFIESPRYNEALYRLGWCYYRINNYPKAISFFTLLADDVQKTRPYDPMQKYTNPSLMDESVEYIGLSFLDYGGPDRAAEYLTRIGGRAYGVNVLRRIGDAYFNEKEDYPNALKAYALLLQLYPEAPVAPSVQNRIVQCHRRLEDQTSAFLAREKLYNSYRDGTSWWDKNSDKEARKRALVYVESALRDNITVLLNRGQETNQLEFFNQAVLQSRRYLATFPTDSSAALIHWNMALTLDTKLKQTAQAFDEYIEISNLYWESRYQRFAAANAVAMARDAAVSAIAAAEQAARRSISLADLQKETKNPQGVKFREKMKLEPNELTLEETRLAQAYDNYIKLFPHDKETPIFLANAGALYYRRYQFKEALRYFNTLLRHFPGSEEFAQARYAIMESYFGKADFRSSEIIARRILISDAPEEVKSRAQRRLAESIYLSAEMLAEENKHLDAGNEYRRVVREAPNSAFADLALFNAALEYDKAGEFNRAIETYTSLLATQPQSAYGLDAQNNLAFDYAELRDYRNAALTYERLANNQPDTLKARDALFNASLYFSRAEDWESAIKTNRTFLKRYPRDEHADEAAFDIAVFYRRLNHFDKSEEAFLDFVKDFPDSPRIVEAYYLRGRRLYETGDRKAARLEFQHAVAASQQLEKRNLDRNDFYAAESEFDLAGLLFDESDRLQFKLPLADLNRNKQRKKELLLEIIHHLSACAAYGTPRVYEATYQVGLAYQKFADTWAGQDLPDMEANRRIVAQKEINDAAVVLSEHAAGVYRQAIKGLQRLRDSYYQNLTMSIVDSLQRRTTVQQDTILRIADRWVERSRERLTEVYYSMGDLRFESARMVQEAPVPRGLNDLQQLVYRKQLLQIGTVPLLKQAFEEHSRNVTVADSMNYASTWVELSRQKLVTIHTAVPASYTKLALDGLTTIADKFIGYSNLIYSGRSLDDLLDDLAGHGRDLANMVDFCHAIMDSAIVGYHHSIASAGQWRASPESIAAVQDSLMERILDFSALCDSLAMNAKGRANMARQRFLATQDPVLEEGLFTFESNYFSLRKANKEVLERGYNLGRELATNSRHDQLVLLRLVALDPDTYAAQAGLTISEMTVATDTTWRAASTYFEGWTGIGFDASSWATAGKADSSIAGAVWLYEPSADTTAIAVVPVTRLYMRLYFSVPGLPVSCRLNYQAPHHVSFYLNGESIKRVKAGEPQEPVDMTDVISSGGNLWAMEVVQAEGSAPGIATQIVVRYVPGWEEKVKSLNVQAASGRNP